MFFYKHGVFVFVCLFVCLFVLFICYFCSTYLISSLCLICSTFDTFLRRPTSFTMQAFLKGGSGKLTKDKSSTSGDAGAKKKESHIPWVEK